MAKKIKGRIVNPPKRKPAKVYGGSTVAPYSIRAHKLARTVPQQGGSK